MREVALMLVGRISWREDENEKSSLLSHENRNVMDEKGRAHNLAGRPLSHHGSFSQTAFSAAARGIGTSVLNPRAN